MSILVPLSSVIDNPFQTRLSYDPEHVAQLAESIRADGQLQPAVGRVVRPDGTSLELDRLDLTTRSEIVKLLRQGALVQLAFGHNRLRAMRQLGTALGAEYWRDGSACMALDLRMLDDEQMARMAWAENEQRKELNAVEEARAIERMIDAFGWTHERVAVELGLARPTVSNKLRLLKLPPEAIEHVADGTLSEGKGRALVSAFEFFEQLSDEDREVVAWARKVYAQGGQLYGEPEHVLSMAVEHNWTEKNIRDAAIGDKWLATRRQWKESDEKRRAQAKKADAKAAAADDDDQDGYQQKLKRIKEERKAKAAAMHERWERTLTEHGHQVSQCEAGSLVVLALALSSVPKPAVERTAKLLGLSFEKDYGVEENLAALSALPYLDAWRLALGALMAKEIDNRKEWEAPAPVFDAVMAGVEHELESGRRIAAERAAREAFESDDPERFLAEARVAGAEARRNGAKPEDNPYPKGGTVIQNQLCAEWIGGYIHADTEHPAEGIAGSGGSPNVSAETVVPETAEAL